LIPNSLLADFFVEVEPGGTLFIVAVVSASAHAVSRIPIPLVIGQFQCQMEIAIKLYCDKITWFGCRIRICDDRRYWNIRNGTHSARTLD
jgi:hypothetical protein